MASYSVFYSGGNLNNGRNGGPFYVNGNNALSTANWNFGSRNSGYCSHFLPSPSVMGQDSRSLRACGIAPRLTKRNSL